MEETAKNIGEISANMCIDKAVVKTTDDLIVKGCFSGIVASTAKVIIATGAKFEGTIIASSVLIEGTISAKVMVKGLAEIAGNAKVNGNLQYGSIHVDEGAVICANTAIISAKEFDKIANANKVYKQIASETRKPSIKQ